MGLMSFLLFSLGYCVTVLAWPLLVLVYPLCASIRAIETNSFADSQTLNAYWVVLSLMLLLEHGFMKLFGWSLSWQYIRIAIVCLFVIPYFDGALYVYKCFIRLLLFVNTQIFINRFKTHKESPLARENFLDELDRYVKENGAEAVEKILSKSYSREPDVSHEDIKSLEVTEKKEVMAMEQDQSYSREPDVSHEDIKSLEVTEKKEVMTMDQDQKAENGTMPTRENVQLNSVSGSSATKSKENTVETAKAPLSSGKKQKPSTMDKENIEKQNKTVPNKQSVETNAAPIWCRVCKIRCSGVVPMESHLKGRKHMARIRLRRL